MLAALGALLGWSLRPGTAARPEPVGLFTSLPLIWGEGEDPQQLLASGQSPHRAKQALAAIGPIRPLDTLDGLQPGLKRLVIAQPRPLSPTENVALDNWLRRGGQLLLLADPMLTEPSVFPLGDPRRPQDIVLLSPILTRWKLELTFDEQQPAGVRLVAADGLTIPVNLAGTWRSVGATCRIAGAGVLAICQVGQGRLVALADAEVLSAHDNGQLRQDALAGLLRRAFSTP